MSNDADSVTARPPVVLPAVLCILDGWGLRAERADNAIAQARTPVWDALLSRCPQGTLEASEDFVGLPAGQMGNSEVGHMNLGAGRVVLQDLPRIDKSLADGSLAANANLLAFIASLRASGGTAHLMGLLSPGGVHSHQSQIAGLAGILAKAGLPVAIHGFLDGRDTPPKSAVEFLRQFEADLGAERSLIRLATVTGRFFAMDRDQRWDRVGAAYAVLVEAQGMAAADGQAAIEAGYERGETDEFIQPTAIGDYTGMKDGDGLIMANFRADRAREILTALTDLDFGGFPRSRVVAFAARLGMVEYSKELSRRLGVLFPPIDLADTLGAVISAAGLRQLRIAETEKYAHVTFFFNGGEETVFPGEERILVPSPKVRTYDEKPEMSAFEVTDRLVEAIHARRFDLIVVNYANTDMVGHTGDLSAATRAVEAVDQCLGRLQAAVEATGAALLITADHGNAEMMFDAELGSPHTAHTLNLVPSILVNGPPNVTALSHGRLADVAPTLLDLMGLAKPAAMTGHSILMREKSSAQAAQ